MDPNSNISRWIAFLVLPLATLIGAFIAIKAKSWFNYDLDPAAAAAYVLGIILAIAGGLITWLRNRGKFEIASALKLDPDNIDAIAAQVLARIPPAPAAPQAPPPGSTGAPPQPRAPGGIASP